MGSGVYLCLEGYLSPNAGVAQLVEHLICNQRVRGSNPFASSSIQKSGSEIQESNSGRQQDSSNFSGATGFSNALHSEIFRRVVIFAAIRKLVSLICRSSGFAQVSKEKSGSVLPRSAVSGSL